MREPARAARIPSGRPRACACRFSTLPPFEPAQPIFLDALPEGEIRPGRQQVTQTAFEMPAVRVLPPQESGAGMKGDDRNIAPEITDDVSVTSLPKRVQLDHE